MKVFKRLLVLGMCVTLLASPLKASASNINIGGALIVDEGKVNALASTDDKEAAKGEIDDFYTLKKEGITDADTLKKLEDIRTSAKNKADSMQTLSGLEELVQITRTQMSAAVTGSSGEDALPPEEEPSADEYSREEAIETIKSYAAGILLNTYDANAVKKTRDEAVDALEITDTNNERYIADVGIPTYVDQIKVLLDKYDKSNEPAEEKEPVIPAPTDYVQVGGNWVTPVATYGQQVNVVLPIVNMGKETVKDVIVTPVLDADPEVWPFDIEKSSYTVKLDALAGERVNKDAMARRQEITWTLRTRQDVTSGFKKIGFNVQYTNSANEQVNVVLYTYIKAVGAPGSGNGEGTSTPRLMVTGFTTVPEKVKAGDAFKLTIHMKNTSKRTAVSNIEFTLKAATEGSDADAVYEAFLPVAGSSSIYVEKIPANGSTDISIDLKSKADLSQKPYVMNINMKYEDDDLNEYSSDSSVSIPVYQEARFEVSEPEVMPGAIDVGSQSNIMFNIYNTGKTTLYNVQVRFEGDSVTGGDAFVGNIQPGGSGMVDCMITGAAPTVDDGIIKAIISYEDNETNTSEYEKDISLWVNEPYIPSEEEMMMDMMPMEEEMQGMPVWLIVLLVAAVIAGIAAAVIIRRKKKKARAASLLEDELADSIGDE